MIASARKRHAILVVGTGRCGSSAMTGVLQFLGTELGSDLKPGDPLNPKGYFENTQITDLNKTLLDEAGIDWYITPIEDVWPVLWTRDRIAAICACVKTTFGDASPIAIKDPRFCLLLDLYARALQQLDIEVHCLRMQRDAKAVARSLGTMVGGEADRWLPIAQHHALLLDEALAHNQSDCLDVAFDDLVTRPSDIVQTVLERFPFLSAARVSEAIAFVDRSLRHHG